MQYRSWAQAGSYIRIDQSKACIYLLAQKGQVRVKQAITSFQLYFFVVQALRTP